MFSGFFGGEKKRDAELMAAAVEKDTDEVQKPIVAHKSNFRIENKDTSTHI